MVKLISAFAFYATLLTVSAVETPAHDIEVIPGPGFPTLEELGVTVADLARPPAGFYPVEFQEDVHRSTSTHKKTSTTKKTTTTHKTTKTTSTHTKTTTTSTHTATTTPDCSTHHRCNVSDVPYCIHYLQRIGQQNCTVQGEVELETVQCGSCKIFLGQLANGTGTILCQYVAQYAANVRNVCKHDRRVSGTRYFPKQIFKAKGYKKNNHVLFVDLREYNGTAS